MGKLPLSSLGLDLGSSHGLTIALEHPIFSSVTNAQTSFGLVPFMPDKSAGGFAGVHHFALTPMIGCPQASQSSDLSSGSSLWQPLGLLTGCPAD
ncbi:hypothetical protein FH972_024998 [Carpinus fangiana]|uniref:Uncharacterized protein n=1 Tax=Carpinus fangiana TaxID=176857 RepID=A0A5N6KZR5_9ROSI|nr:hypothetical protein FH972_024998 [Carpinus fangiana]